MSKNRRANAVLFGFDFQVNSAIVLMLENIEELKTLRLEGNYEDIELELSNGKYILAQAKAVVKSSYDFKNVRKNLQKSLVSLSEGSQKIDVQQLIFITNSPNPLKEENSRSIFFGDAHREFVSLPPSSQQLIKKYLNEIKQPLDAKKFMIQVLPFETDNDMERYKFIRQVVDNFIGDLDLSVPGIGKKILNIWHNDVFKNGTKREPAIKLSKKDIIWPLMVIVINTDSSDDPFREELDCAIYEEIVQKYKEVIDSCCERYEIFIKVLCDYNIYETTKKQSEKCKDFIINKWRDYLEEFGVNDDEEVQKGLIQIILYKIIRNRIVIQKIKKGVNL